MDYYYHILLVVLICSLLILVLYAYKYYSFTEFFFVGEDITLGNDTNNKPIETNETNEKKIDFTNIMDTFKKKFKKTPKTTQLKPSFDGSEYNIENSYEETTEYGNVMRTTKRDKEDLNSYEDIPFIKNIINNNDKKRDWKDISSKNKKFIAQINKVDTTYAQYTNEIIKDKII
tara:strand:- start:541 stop:1062 length:522 start_codon:yes stop_codon:yes gene_type:complete